MKKNTLMVIGSLDKFILLNTIFNEWYDMNVALDLDMARSCLKLNVPDIILLDAKLVDYGDNFQFNFCNELKKDTCLAQNIPIILLTQSQKEIEKGFDLDIVDHLNFPIQREVALRRISTYIALGRAQAAQKNYASELELKVRERTQALLESQKAAIFMLGEAGHYNDNDTGVHIWRMAAYSAQLAKKVGWNSEECELLEMAAPMHDTGKIGIPDNILKKPGSLTQTQWNTMKSHTIIGRDILAKSDTPLFQLAAEIAENHHEKWDGSGYPNGLSKEQIPYCARIVMIADVFDALTMKRSYKDAWSIESAFKEIEKGAGSHFDPTLVCAFLSIKQELLVIKNKFE